MRGATSSTHGVVDRRSAAAAIVLLGAAAVAWIGLSRYEAMGLPGFLAGWTLMMAAMMLPSITPLVLLYRGSRTALALGYLAVWGALGLLPYAAMELDVAPALPIVLAAAGLYELSPLKHACLRRCRDAITFLMERYRSGPFRLGLEHGLWCMGCCVGLMAVLVLATTMSLPWAAAIAALVFVQKVLPGGGLTARLTGVFLLVSAVVLAM